MAHRWRNLGCMALVAILLATGGVAAQDSPGTRLKARDPRWHPNLDEAMRGVPYVLEDLLGSLYLFDTVLVAGIGAAAAIPTAAAPRCDSAYGRAAAMRAFARTPSAQDHRLLIAEMRNIRQVSGPPSDRQCAAEVVLSDGRNGRAAYRLWVVGQFFEVAMHVIVE